MRSVLRFSLTIGLSALILGSSEDRAVAQFGYGFGFGGGNELSIQQQGYLNSRSLQMGARATMGPKQNNVYAGNPNAYVNRLRDPGYLDKWDTGTRREIESRIGRYSDGPAPSRAARTVAVAAAPAPAPAKPVIPLASFFDRYSKLVWPDGSPEYGDLKSSRAISDQASLAVLNDFKLNGLASLANVTSARSRLLDYGRPALAYIRANSTARIADTFHLFLLSLYESLAQAATIPASAAAAR